MTASVQSRSDRYMILGDYIDGSYIPDQATRDAVYAAVADNRNTTVKPPTGQQYPNGRYLVLHKDFTGTEKLSWETLRPGMGKEFTLADFSIPSAGVSEQKPANEEDPETIEIPFSHIDDYPNQPNPTPLPDVAGDVSVLVDYIIPTLSTGQLQALARDAIIDSPERLNAFGGTASHKVKTDRECRRLFREEENKIGAIKHARQEFGMGLKEAKEYVEAL